MRSRDMRQWSYNTCIYAVLLVFKLVCSNRPWWLRLFAPVVSSGYSTSNRAMFKVPVEITRVVGAIDFKHDLIRIRIVENALLDHGLLRRPNE